MRVYLTLFLGVGAVSVFLLQMRTQDLNYLPIVEYSKVIPTHSSCTLSA